MNKIRTYLFFVLVISTASVMASDDSSLTKNIQQVYQHVQASKPVLCLQKTWNSVHDALPPRVAQALDTISLFEVATGTCVVMTCFYPFKVLKAAVVTCGLLIGIKAATKASEPVQEKPKEPTEKKTSDN